MSWGSKPFQIFPAPAKASHTLTPAPAGARRPPARLALPHGGRCPNGSPPTRRLQSAFPPRPASAHLIRPASAGTFFLHGSRWAFRHQRGKRCILYPDPFREFPCTHRTPLILRHQGLTFRSQRPNRPSVSVSGSLPHLTQLVFLSEVSSPRATTLLTSGLGGGLAYDYEKWILPSFFWALAR